MLTKRNLLYLTIAVEGYVVLATELVAMRTLIPFVGSGTEVVAIVISAVLLPLALGYHSGGTRFQQQFKRTGEKLSVRRLLLKNILASLLVLTFGLSYVVQRRFFAGLDAIGVQHYLAQTALFCVVFLVWPVYLLAQTIPLLSNFFSSGHLSQSTGRMLFFSSVGSFGGSVFSTLVLMSLLGVHATLVVTLALLACVFFLLTKRRYAGPNAAVVAVLAAAALFNSPPIMDSFGIVSNNQYSMIQIFDQTTPRPDGDEHWKIMTINSRDVRNGAMSSAYGDKGGKLPAHAFIEKSLLPRDGSGRRPLDVLVLGAAGFALGLRDETNRFTFVDIDPSLKDVAEKHFLPGPLQPNKSFVPMSARAFLRADARSYDLIVVDVFTNTLSIPQEVVTKEFLQEAKAKLRAGGVVVSNLVSSPDYRDAFSVRYQNTFEQVFPHSSRQIVGDFNVWNAQEEPTTTMFLYFDRPYVADAGLYTDDKNRFSLDR